MSTGSRASKDKGSNNGSEVKQKPPPVPLNSLQKYEKWTKMLRAAEEKERKAIAYQQAICRDTVKNNFIRKCERKSLMYRLARRVEFCFEAFEDSMNNRRKRLTELLNLEEMANISKFVKVGQAGKEALYQEKVERLHYLLNKRREEYEKSTKEPPIAKTMHIHPDIVAVRAKEAQDIQKFQMRENQMRKMSEREIDNMWIEVGMKEAEALAARVEYDEIVQFRQNQNNRAGMDLQMQQIREFKEKERERLKRETIWFKELLAEADRKEAEAERRRDESRRDMVQVCRSMIAENRAIMAQKKIDGKLIQDTWDSLTGQGLADDRADKERRIQMRREVDLSNVRMLAIRNQMDAYKQESDPLIKQEGQRRQDALDLERCLRLKKTRESEKENVRLVTKQIREKEIARRSRYDPTDEYNSQVLAQNAQLLKYNEVEEQKVRMEHEKDIIDQIEYNIKVRERAKQTANDEYKKFEIAKREYEQSIQKLLCRPSFSQDTHPFMRIMNSGIGMNMAMCAADRKLCPCPAPGGTK